MKKNLIIGVQVLIMSGVFGFASVSQAYEAGTVDNGGAVTGKVIFTGGSVPMRTVVPTKNKDVCGSVRQEPLVEVGSENGVINAVAILKDITKGKAWGPPAGEYKLDNIKCVFQPHVQVVPIGSDLTIHNSDPFLHNTHSFYGDKTAFNVALPFPGAQVKRKLDKPGVVRIDCDVHGWMQGWVYVADNPYYEITGADGSFVISDIPPGDYTLLIWQEHGGAMERKVAVKAGETVDIGMIEIK